MRHIKVFIFCIISIFAVNSYAQEMFCTVSSNGDSLCFLIPKFGNQNKVAFAGSKNSVILNVPASVSYEGKTYEVCAIAFQAMTGNRKITEINLPASIHAIEANAFEGCINLKKVNMAEGISIINDYAFQDCTSLRECVIPKSVKKIGEAVFRGCDHLRSVSLPDDITEIPYKLFMGCFKLQNINIPSGVTHIGDYAFCNCTMLRQLVIPDNAVIEKHSLQGCGAAAKYNAKIQK